MTVPTLDHIPAACACLISLAGRTLAVEITEAREARAFDEFTPVPLAPACVIGMANLRGAIVPIVDLRVLLGLPPVERPRTLRTLVVEAAGARIALAVDAVLGVRWSDDPIVADGAVDRPGFERAVFGAGDDATPVLDVVKIVELLARQASSRDAVMETGAREVNA